MTAPARSFHLSQLTSDGVAIKICGIREPGHARVAAEAGANMIGLVFAPSKRQVTVEAACAIVRALDALEKRPSVVGVFVNEAPRRILEVAGRVGLDIIQLSGDEPPEAVLTCADQLPTIKGLRFRAGTHLEKAARLLTIYQALEMGERLRFLIDAYHPQQYGGTGDMADWSLAATLAQNTPLMLAGGLNPENVGEALATVRPWGIDVSSGVERDGAKDDELIKQFISAARS